MSLRQTLFSDVCGTMDELKRLVHEEPERVAADPEGTIVPLVKDALFMLERMETRLSEYRRLREEVGSAVSQCEPVPKPDPKKVREALVRISDVLGSSGRGPDVDTVDTLAEETRAVASAQEHRLRAQKDLALKLHDLFVRIKGSRPWILSEADAESHGEAIKKRYQAWLPPEPHSGELLGRLADSRASVVEDGGPDGEPMVQFMDGGAMRMSQVRWDPHVRNFHPAGFQPGPTGRDYSPPRRQAP